MDMVFEPTQVGKMRELGEGYTSEVDTASEQQCCQLLREFDDANLYQTWSYTAVTGGRHTSHLILRKDGNVAALAQARIAKVPYLNAGIAYVRWGPLWRKSTGGGDAETLRQAIRALRNEFVCKRGLVLRLFPILLEDDPPQLSSILAEEGFTSSRQDARSRTILMDLTPSLAELHDGMRPHWKRELKIAERKGLEIVEGSDDGLFGTFIGIYREMVSRKQFAEGNDINQFRRIQQLLPDSLKMKIMLCKAGSDVCAGLVCSVVGRVAIYLFGATSNAGMKSNGSYLLHWKLIESLKKDGCALYDLNGVNLVKNPGTYKFKHDLAGRHGREVSFLGRFDSRGGVLSNSCVRCGEGLKGMYQIIKQLPRSIRGTKLRPKEAS